MKTQFRNSALIVAAVFAGLAANASPVVLPVTYQGRLFDGTNAANGQYEIRFGVFPASTSGVELGAMTNTVTVADGLFTTTLDLDRDWFPDPTSSERWLEIGVRTNGSPANFTYLSARQELTFAPYAIRSSFASVAESLAANSVSGSNFQTASITADKIDADQVVKSLNALHDDVTLSAGANTTITPAGNILTIAGTTDWHLGGNAGTTPGTDFIGTTDNQPLEFKVNGQRAFELASPSIGAPMVIGGAGNSINDVSGGTIAGGYSNVIASAAYESAIGGGALNSIQSGAHQSWIGGGAFNIVGFDAGYGTIAGGSNNIAGADFSFVGGGTRNAAWGTNSTISGGYNNNVQALAGTISGGWGNYLNAQSGVIAGGTQNHITGSSSSAVVGGGYQNFIEGAGFAATIGGGWFNYTAAPYSTIGGGSSNTNSQNYATIGGGHGNSIDLGGEGVTIAGGAYNADHGSSLLSTIGGGIENTLSNTAWATIAGGQENRLLNCDNAVISGGEVNIVSNAPSAVIGGGSFNTNFGSYAFIGSGKFNRVIHLGSISYGSGSFGVIAGGSNNWVNQDFCVVGGGSGNQAGDDVYLSYGYDTVAGGANNKATDDYGTVSGGYLNQATGYSATVAGGNNNVASGSGSTVLGGVLNHASGDYSIAAGLYATAAHNGTFVWSDDTPGPFSSTTTNQFAIRANSGVMIQSTNVALDLRGGGAIRVAGAGEGSSTPAFIQRATAANTGGDRTVIDHPQCNNDPNAILIVTQNWNPGGGFGTYNAHPVGVYYNGTHWAIFNEDAATMPTNVAFNVLIIKQ